MIVFEVKVFPDSRLLITPICGKPMAIGFGLVFLMTAKDGCRGKKAEGVVR